MYNILIPQFTKMLKNLDHLLDKGAEYASAKKFDFEVLLNTRLAPDQFTLLKQIQIACDVAKLGASRLTGKDAPTNDDKETTLPELKKRIQQTISYLATFTKDDFNGADERKVSQPRWEGKYLTGYEYAMQHTIPNLYFHITTTYAILRNNGVDVGKKDYLGEMPFKK
jgi:hypothetical protein